MMTPTEFDAVTKIWRRPGKEPIADVNSVSCGSTLLQALENYPDDIAQINDNNGVQLTNSEIRLRSIRAAQNLTKNGIKSGDVIQLIASNHHNLAPVVFGAACIGAPVNSLDVKFKDGEIAHMFNLTEPKLIVCDYESLDIIERVFKLINKTVPVYTFDKSDHRSRSVDELLRETFCEQDFRVDDAETSKHPLCIACTSGTTGLSKGVSISHISLLEACTMENPLATDRTTQVFLNYSSLYWLSGWITLFTTTFKSFKRLITTEPFAPELFLRMTAQYKATMFFSSPTYMAVILQHKSIETADLSSLNAYFCGGSVVSYDLCVRMNKYLKNGMVLIGYGMSEVSGAISTALAAFQPNSVGQLTPGGRAKIINDDGDSLIVGEEGEICVKPLYPFMGYYRDPENTKKFMDEEGWLHTGDLGYFDENSNLYIVGRKKELLKYFGSQVSPVEIENILIKVPGVANACVVGIPDDIAGELPAAMIVKNNAVDITESEIHALLKEKLSDPKQLRGGIYFVDKFPETPSGKVLKREVLKCVIQNRAVNKI